MERIETYLGQNPILALMSGFTSIFSSITDVINPLINIFIGIGSLVVIILTIEAKIKERKNLLSFPLSRPVRITV